MKVAVYLGSRTGKGDTYVNAAKNLGEQLAQNGHTIIYGGSTIGMMGELADAALTLGGKVIGIMPTHLVAREVAHNGLTELYEVDTMHTRKFKMAELAEAFVAMPGGCGTLDEFFEIFTWAQINLHTKPVILLNINGFYNALLEHFDKMIEEGFVPEAHRALVKVARNVEEVLELLKSSTEAKINLENLNRDFLFDK